MEKITIMKMKKHPNANLEKKRASFLLLGTTVSLAIALMAFEFNVFNEDNLSGLPKLDTFNPFEEDPIPITVVKKELPKPQPPKLKLNPDKIKLVDKIDVPEPEPIIDVDSLVIDIPILEPEPIVEEDLPRSFVEEMPEFPGGAEGLFKYLSEKIDYPAMAVDADIQGTVYLTFVIDEDGNVYNIEVLNGLQGGCTEEAIRVVKNMPKWKPGKQQGRKVKVQYNLPIRFQLK